MYGCFIGFPNTICIIFYSHPSGYPFPSPITQITHSLTHTCVQITQLTQPNPIQRIQRKFNTAALLGCFALTFAY